MHPCILHLARDIAAPREGREFMELAALAQQKSSGLMMRIGNSSYWCYSPLRLSPSRSISVYSSRSVRLL